MQLPVKYLFSLILLLGCSLSQFAQQLIEKNLVPNYSFENARKKSSNIKAAVPWTGISTVDYYTKAIEHDTTPEKGARTGECYAGLRFQKKYKEYLAVKLAEPLRRGTKYQLECYIRLAYWSNATVKSFGMFLSKAPFADGNFAQRAYLIDTIEKKNSLHGNYRWFRVKGVYQAEGGEKYLTIGNFSPNVRADMVKMNIWKLGFKEAYYFVDDVSIKPIFEKEDIKVVWVDSLRFEKDSVLQVAKNLKAGEKIVLNNIQFEKSHSYITPESHIELNKLAQYLFRHPHMVVRINGHSDNSGSRRKNQKISEERARAVFEYLISKGVQNKMYFKGFGTDLPIADNNSEEGKAKNRRVEFEVISE